MQMDNYQSETILHYNRKLSTKNRNGIFIDAYVNDRREANNDLDLPRGERRIADSACCSCGVDTDGEISNIFHKKCPVIALAQQQLQKLLDETDKILCDNTMCCRSVYDVWDICKNYLLDPSRSIYVILALILLTLLFGLFLGASTCGTCLRKFNSPIFNCIDNFFMFEKFWTVEESYRVVV